MFDMFISAFSSACSMEALVANFIGVALGIVFGALPGLTAVMGVALLTFFYVVNLMGMNIMAKVQKLMVWLLIAALLLFTVVGIAKIKLPIFDFNDPNWLINGWGVTFNEKGLISGGFFGAVVHLFLQRLLRPHRLRAQCKKSPA